MSISDKLIHLKENKKATYMSINKIDNSAHIYKIFISKKSFYKTDQCSPLLPKNIQPAGTPTVIH